MQPHGCIYPNAGTGYTQPPGCERSLGLPKIGNLAKIRAMPDAQLIRRPARDTELEVSPALERVILACLAKRPEDRPQSAGSLERLLADIEIEPWSEEDATRWWRQHQPA